MNRKKIFSLLLCSVFVFTSFSTAQAAVDLQPETQNSIYKTWIKPGEENLTYVTNISPEIEKKVKISKEKALEIGRTAFKQYFNNTIDDSKFSVKISLDNYNNGEAYDYIWNISWSKNNISKNINYNVSIIASTGKIQSINNAEYNRDDTNSIPTISLKEARGVADTFVKTHNAEKFSEVSRVDTDFAGYHRNGSGSYSFSYIRKVNDIEFTGNTIEVSIDGTSGKVTSYSINWDDKYTFQDTKSVISKEKAQNILKNSISMDLKYVNYYDRYDDTRKKKEIKVVYSTSFKKGNGIDANSGTFINNNLNNESNLILKDLNEKEKTEFYKKYSVINVAKEPIIEENAAVIMKETIKDLYGEDYKLDPLAYNESSDLNDESDKTWSVQFYKDENKKYEHSGSIKIDALTGRVISCYKNSPYEQEQDFKEKLTWDQAYDKAINTVAKYFPSHVKNIKTQQTHIDKSINPVENKYKERLICFNFARTENGIEYYENNINVTVDLKTGEVNNIIYRWEDKLKFPSLENKISEKDALNKFLQKYNTKLTYNLVNTSKDLNKPKFEPKLIYAVDFGNRQVFDIDAFNGKFVSYDAEEVNENIETFMNNIKNSKYEKELSILAYKGLLNTKDFKLNKEVTQIDLIKSLVDAKGFRPYEIMFGGAAKESNVKADSSAPVEELRIKGVQKGTQDYKYLQMAVSYGIIDNEEVEFKGDTKVTREEMAKILVRFINYHKVVDCGDIFKANFKDTDKLTKGYLGYVALAEGFGLVQLDKGNFNPKNISTMEELTLGIYKSLNKIRFNNYPIYY
ncbi:MAG: YcdB/YcdC domain-containing protein [Clostridium sp.]|uniref:YcdB/YcdC domain-containing protein n=1 Tax=Clostridium sp. TaxID=1506 RepID=UPI003D6CE63D